jgi:hypothetical protein
MGGFIYFSKNSIKNNEDLNASEMGYLVDESGGPNCAGCSTGPNGEIGTMFCMPDSEGRHPALGCDHVKWHETSHKYWIGYRENEFPSPEALARRKMFNGHYVRLGDGAPWLVPVARLVDGGSVFPRRLAWDGKNWNPGDILNKYKGLFEDACKFWDALANGGQYEFSDGANLAAAALGLNYKISPEEISILGLFTTETQRDALMAVVDWQTVVELSKKNRTMNQKEQDSNVK